MEQQDNLRCIEYKKERRRTEQVHLDLDPIEQGADLAERLARNAELPEAWIALRRMVHY